MLKRNHAWLVGYYGMQNSGDDALLMASLFGAREYLNCTKIAVASTGKIRLDPETTISASLKKEQEWRGQNRLTHYLQALQSKRVIFGGGSVFHTASDINQKRHMIKLADAKKSMALGVSLGPFVNTEAELACQKFLNECGFVALRDQLSYDIAKTLAPQANIKKTFDLALLLANHPSFVSNQGERNGLLFNVCPVAKNAFGSTDPFEEELRIKALCEVIKALWKRTGERITLISLNGHKNLGDSVLSDTICEKLRTEMPIAAIPYNANPLKVINVISHFKAMVSMRLHGNIFAYMTNTPCISLNYHPKCEQWCEQISSHHSLRFDATKFSKRRLFNVIERGLNHGFPMPQMPVATATELSELNWRNSDEQNQIFGRHTPVQQS